MLMNPGRRYNKEENWTSIQSDSGLKAPVLQRSLWNLVFKMESKEDWITCVDAEAGFRVVVQLRNRKESLAAPEELDERCRKRSPK